MKARWVILILAACLVVTVAAIAYAAGKTSPPEVIQAQRFEVVDAVPALVLCFVARKGDEEWT